MSPVICFHTLRVVKLVDVVLAPAALRQPEEQLTASRFAPRDRLDK